MEYASASTTAIRIGRKPTRTVMPEAKAAVPQKNACSSGSGPITCNSAPSNAMAAAMPLAAVAMNRAKRMTMMRPRSAKRLIHHRHSPQRHALARGELLGRALELAAGGENVASARGAHRRGVAGVEHHLRKLLNLFPVGTFVLAAGPGIERNEIDLGRDT